jgi:Putative auto-transporter adhesin, head GIN domain
MKTLFLLLAVVAAGIQLQAQQTINDPNAQVRNVKGFHAIKVSNAIDLYLSQSNDEVVVVSAADVKFRDRMRTVVENGVLKIWLDQDDWNWLKNTGNKKMKAYVSFKALDRLIASGACDVRVTGVIKSDKLTILMSGASNFKGEVDVESLKIVQSGASDATIKGKANTLEAEASGASDLKGYELQTQNCKAHASGASDLQISVSKELNAQASGSSDIFYKGEPVIKEKRSSGSSSVSKRS